MGLFRPAPIRRLVIVAAAALGGACALGSAAPIRSADVPPERLTVIRRSHVWRPTRVSAMNLRRGPQGPDAFAPGQTVSCDYVKEKQDGGTPKFKCAVSADDAVKVKYGEENGEVFGEVAASRLLWALGFPADAEYPVRVICRGCSLDPWTKPERIAGETVFEYAAIERKFPAREIAPGDKIGWSWPELDLVDESAGGAPRAQRDALKLLAVFLQHTDSKREQQRFACLDDGDAAAKDPDASRCGTPIMLINDLGLTFGRANAFNRNRRGSTNYEAWARVPVWKDPAACIGNLPKSLTGTLEHPHISEEGRKFLAGLLAELSDSQLRDLFEVSRVSRRAVDGEPQRAGVDDWVSAFKQKRNQIVGHSCGKAQEILLFSKASRSASGMP